MQRSAKSVWRGAGRDGKGALTTPSGVLKDTAYDFSQRFGDASVTNPEELIAAAHAGCFNMALAFALTNAGFPAEELATQATLSAEKKEEGWRIVASHLELTAKVPGISAEQFAQAAQGAKAGCPVSALLNAKISLSATLNGAAVG